MSIDTACSSSLVGAHLAATSFLAASCPRALVAGVNLTLRAETTAVLARAGMLAQARAPCAIPPCLLLPSLAASAASATQWLPLDCSTGMHAWET